MFSRSKQSRSTVRFLSAQSHQQFGYVSFRQRKDASNPRGYFQKSVVVLSALPCLSLFSRVVASISEAYHAYGASAVEGACTTISRWVSPHPGRRVTLPLLGTMLVDVLPLFASMSPSHEGEKEGSLALLPTAKGADGKAARQFTFASAPGATSTSTSAAAPLQRPTSPTGLVSPSSSSISLSSLFSSIHHSHSSWFHSINLFTTFRSHVHNLWFLWELTLTGCPLLLLSRSPSACSDSVLALLSLISPVLYRGDYRPYFTIYDPDFRHYQSLHDIDVASLPAVMLGVTNPFFLKVLERWPNICIMGDDADAAAALGGGGGGGLDLASPPSSPQPPSSPSPQTSGGGGSSGGGSGAVKLRMMHKLHKSLDSASLDSSRLPAALVSKATPLLIPDEAVLKRLILDPPSSPPAAARPSSPSAPSSPSPPSSPSSTVDEINNAVLRRAFHELTQLFLRPFLPFLIVTPELQQAYATDPHWNPYTALPSLPRFSEAELLTAVAALPESELRLFPMSGMKAGRRHKLTELYRRFLRSNQFVYWYSGMREDAEALLWQMAAARIRRLSEAGGEEMERLLERETAAGEGELCVAMWKQALSFMERAVVGKGGAGGSGGGGGGSGGEAASGSAEVVDVQLVSCLLLHMAMLKRSAPIEQMLAIGKLELEQAQIIERFAKKTQLHRDRQQTQAAQQANGTAAPHRDKRAANTGTTQQSQRL